MQFKEPCLLWKNLRPTIRYSIILTSRVNPSLPPRVTGQYRVGDVRHSLAEISKAKKILGYEPEYDLGIGIEQFLEWANREKSIDSSDQAEAQLHGVGMLK